jgi:hypothetical protein
VGKLNPTTDYPQDSLGGEGNWLETANLQERFDNSCCYIPANDDLIKYNSKVVILMDSVKHILHSSCVEFYLADNFIGGVENTVCIKTMCRTNYLCDHSINLSNNE